MAICGVRWAVQSASLTNHRCWYPQHYRADPSRDQRGQAIPSSGSTVVRRLPRVRSVRSVRACVRGGGDCVGVARVGGCGLAEMSPMGLGRRSHDTLAVMHDSRACSSRVGYSLRTRLSSPRGRHHSVGPTTVRPHRTSTAVSKYGGLQVWTLEWTLGCMESSKSLEKSARAYTRSPTLAHPFARRDL